MSHSRDSDHQNHPVSIYQKLNALFSTNDVARITGQYVFTLPILVTSTYALDVMYMLKTTGYVNAYKPSFLFPYFAGNWKNLFKGYALNYGQASVKSLVTSQSSHIHGEVKNTLLNEEEHINIHNDTEIPLSKRISVTMVAAGLMAFADLVATNYWANLRALAQLSIQPTFGNRWDKMRFASLTSAARFAGLSISAGGYIAGPTLVKRPIDELFPVTQYGMLSQTLTILTTGFMAGLSANAFFVIRNNQLKQIDLQHLTTPSMLSTANELYQKAGAKTFMRGNLISAGYNIMAYSALAMADYAFNDVLFPDLPKSMMKTKQLEYKREPETAVSVDSPKKADSSPISLASNSHRLFSPKKTPPPSSHPEQTNSPTKKYGKNE